MRKLKWKKQIIFYLIVALIITIAFYSTIAFASSGNPEIISPTENKTINNTAPTITWSIPDTQSEYQIQVSSFNDFSTIEEDTGWVVSTTASHTLQAKADGTWYVRVKIKDDLSIESDWSTPVSFKIDTIVPNDANPQATNITETSVTITNNLFSDTEPSSGHKKTTYFLHKWNGTDWESIDMDGDGDIDEYINVFEDTTSIFINDLIPSTLYHYTVIHYDNADNSGINEYKEFYTLSSLPIPSNITTISKSNSISLTWENVNGAIGYEIEIDEVIIDNGINTSYENTGLTIGTEHTYRIRAKNETSVGPWSEQITKSTLSVPINAEITVDGDANDWTDINVTATGTGDVTDITAVQSNNKLYLLVRGTSLDVLSELYLDIDNNQSSGFTIFGDWLTAGADYYVENNTLYTYTGTGTDWSWDNIGLIEINKTSSVIELSIDLSQLELIEPQELKLGYIRNCTDYTPDKYVEMATITTLVNLIDIPSNITTTSKSNSINLTWENVNGAIGYDIEIDGVIIDNGINTSYEDTGLTIGTEHTYKIRAKDETTVGPWSEQIAKSTLSVPINAEITVDGDAIDWTDINVTTTGTGEVTDLTAVQSNNKLYLLVRGTSLDVLSELYIDIDNNQSTGFTIFGDWLTAGADYYVENNTLYTYTGTGTDWSWDNIGLIEINKTSSVIELSIDLSQLELIEPQELKLGYIRNCTDYTPDKYVEMATITALVNLIDVPYNITTISKSNSINLTWENVNGAAGYDIETDGIIIDNGINTSYEHTGLTIGTEHTYRIRAKNETSVGPWSEQITKSTLSAPINAEITVDGDANDWTDINVTTTGTGEVTDLTAVQSNNKLYLLVRGTSLDVLSELYIDIDNNQSTGFTIFGDWLTAGADYYLENNTLYTYTGTGSDWSWDNIGVIDITKTSSVIELSIDLSQIGLTEPQELKLGYIRNCTDYAPDKYVEMATITKLVNLIDIPSNITTISKSNSISVTWENVNGAIGYEIEIDGVIIDNGINTSYEYTGLTLGTEHTYRIRAKDETTVGAWSEQITKSTLSAPINAEISVDGDANDWTDISITATGTGEVTDLTAVQSNNKLYLLVKGTSLDVFSELYIDIDNNKATGYTIFGDWLTAGADYYIENSTLYTYTGTGSDWSWDNIGVIEINKTSSVIELSIDLCQIGLTEPQELKLGYIRNCTDYAPDKYVEMATITTLVNLIDIPSNITPTSKSNSINLTWENVNGAIGYEIEIDGVIIDNGINTSYEHTGLTIGTEHTYRIRAKDETTVGPWSEQITKSTLSEPFYAEIEVDGDVNDWTDINITATGTGEVTDITGVQSENKLYLLVRGTSLDVLSELYLDIDNNQSTGFTIFGDWLTVGADYYVENNTLYTYTGTGTDWSWDNIGVIEINKTSSVIELSIDLSQLGLIEPQELKLGYIRNCTEYVPDKYVEMLTITTLITNQKPSASRCITLDNSSDFNIVKNINDTEDIRVLKLDTSWIKQNLTETDKQYLTWITSDSSVVKFYDENNQQVETLSGKDNATLIMIGEGSSDITITYDVPDKDSVTLKCNVVVEGSTPTTSISNVTVQLDGIKEDDFILSNLTLQLFDLQDVYSQTFNDDDLLKMNITPVHALLQALEIENSTETTSTDISQFDWDWVKNNVTITSNGSYITVIGKDENDWINGWQYSVNSSVPDNVASLYQLNSNDVLVWQFITYKY